MGTESWIVENNILKCWLCQLCDDLENCRGAVSTWEVPDYVEKFWKDNREWFNKEKEKIEMELERQKRFEQYLKLKEEFEPTPIEVKIPDIDIHGTANEIMERFKKDLEKNFVEAMNKDLK